MSALERINKLTLSHLDAVRIATAHYERLLMGAPPHAPSEACHRRLLEVIDAIAPYIARAQMDTEAQSGEAA